MNEIHLDVVIFGGGGAGLWLLDDVVRSGHDALLVETTALGTGQTTGSQGIIHGGLKYTLGGMLTGSAEAIRDMPAHWQSCLAGQCQPDLSEVELRSDTCLMWRTASLTSQLGMLGARVGLKTKPEKVPSDQIPVALHGCPGEVFRVAEQVIDPVGFTKLMGTRNSSRLLLADSTQLSFDMDDGTIQSVHLQHEAHACTLRPSTVVFTAGAGNGFLREQAGLGATSMQLRPLNMILVRGSLPELNGHCVDGAKTRVTITSATDTTGRRVWQLGGQVAEDGVSLNDNEAMANAKSELQSVLPNVNFDDVQWSTYRVDRAEARTADGSRPDGVQILHEGNIITGWPTKLALFPLLSSEIQSLLDKPGGQSDSTESVRDWPRPPVALPPWETRKHWFNNSEIG